MQWPQRYAKETRGAGQERESGVRLSENPQIQSFSTFSGIFLMKNAVVNLTGLRITDPNVNSVFAFHRVPLRPLR